MGLNYIVTIDVPIIISPEKAYTSDDFENIEIQELTENKNRENHKPEERRSKTSNINARQTLKSKKNFSRRLVVDILSPEEKTENQKINGKINV